MRVRQAWPSWQATLPPAALGEERQVRDQVSGASRLTANANTAAVVARELILAHIVVTRFGWKSSPSRLTMRDTIPPPLTVQADTTVSRAPVALFL